MSVAECGVGKSYAISSYEWVQMGSGTQHPCWSLSPQCLMQHRHVFSAPAMSVKMHCVHLWGAPVPADRPQNRPLPYTHCAYSESDVPSSARIHWCASANTCLQSCSRQRMHTEITHTLKVWHAQLDSGAEVQFFLNINSLIGIYHTHDHPWLMLMHTLSITNTHKARTCTHRCLSPVCTSWYTQTLMHFSEWADMGVWM